jgi:phosphatidate cytidylyltransferase
VLRTRVITALILAPLTLWIVWWAPHSVLAAVFLPVVALAALEWAPLAGLRDGAARIGYAAATTVLVALVALTLPGGPPLLAAAVAVWGAALLWLALFIGGHSVGGGVVVRMLAGPLLLGAAYFGLVALHREPVLGAYWVTQLFILVWGSDIGGYFAGRAFGRRKLAPRVSPAKTWEGAVGGLLLGVGAATVFHAAARAVGRAPELSPAPALAGAALVVAVAIAGDLFESMLKRQAGVKDSGRIMPGHGGVLDRLDALLPAAPVLALMAALAG